MKLFRNDQDEVKLIWKVLLLLGGFFIVTILLNEFLVWITAGSLIHESITTTTQARSFISEDLASGNLLALFEGIIWFLMVWFLVSGVEKRSLKSQLTGFQWNSKSIWMILVGILLAVIYVYLAIGLNVLLLRGNAEHYALQLNGNTGLIVFTIISALVLAFSQELVFRSYLQDLLINKFGVGGGVFLTAVFFVICSVILRTLPIIEILSGLFLYVIIGYIYYRVRSLYLVGSLHTALILLPALFSVDAPGEERFLASVLFMIAGLYYFNRKDEKVKQKKTKPSEHGVVHG